MKLRTIGALAGLVLPAITIAFSGTADAQTPTASCVAQLLAEGRTQYPPAAARLQVNQNSTSAGGSVTVTGCGTPSGTVTFTLRSHPINLGSATTDATGRYRASLAIPCDAEPGAHTLSASGAANESTPLNVSGTTGACARAARTAGNLPRTGSSSNAPLAAAGAGLVLIGAATAVTARRRRATASV